MATCANGHEVSPSWAFCPTCGAPFGEPAAPVRPSSCTGRSVWTAGGGDRAKRLSRFWGSRSDIPSASPLSGGRLPSKSFPPPPYQRPDTRTLHSPLSAGRIHALVPARRVPSPVTWHQRTRDRVACSGHPVDLRTWLDSRTHLRIGGAKPDPPLRRQAAGPGLRHRRYRPRYRRHHRGRLVDTPLADAGTNRNHTSAASPRHCRRLHRRHQRPQQHHAALRLRPPDGYQLLTGQGARMDRSRPVTSIAYGGPARTHFLHGYDVTYSSNTTGEAIESTLFTFASPADASGFEPQVVGDVQAASLSPTTGSLTSIPNP